MRKKKHLREKLDAKKISKRDDFDENMIENRKSTGSSEKGKYCTLFCREKKRSEGFNAGF